MPKTESTAVTRLIELAQSRPVEGELDWFGAPAKRPRPQAPRDTTMVVRWRRREGVVIKTRHVVGAFIAGALTVGLAWAVTRDGAAGAPAAIVAAAEPVAAPAPVVAPAPQQPPPAMVPAPIVVALEPEPELVIEPVVEPAPEPVAEPEPAVVGPARAVAPRRPRALHVPRARRPSPTAAKPAAAAAGATAQLLVGSKPPCELYVDGALVGWTPQRGLALAPGKHVLTFRNAEHGIERRIAVIARAGETVKLIRDFTDSVP